MSSLCRRNGKLLAGTRSALTATIIRAIVDAIDAAKENTGKPHAIVLDTLMGKGVRTFEERDKNHFIRVEPDEWRLAREQLEENAQPKAKRNA